MNLAALRTAVERRTGVAMDAAALTEWVNEASKAIAAEHDWPWLQRSTTFPTVAGTGTYTPPADWLRTISLRIADDAQMSWQPAGALDDAWPYADSRGQPYQWSTFADELVLRPIPDGVHVVTHRYVRIEADLALDADTPLMPVLFRPAIVEYAAYLVARSAGQSVRAAESLQAWSGWKGRMLDDVRRQSGPAKVRLRSRR